MKNIVIPKGPSAFNDYQAEFVDRCIAGAGSWHIPDEAIAALTSRRSRWEPAYAVTANRNTSCPAATEARKAVYTPYRETIIQTIYKYLMGNEAIPEAELSAMGIHEKAGGRSAKGAPVSYPVIQIDYKETTAHHLIYYDSAASDANGKPDGVTYCEVWYQVGGEAPAAPVKEMAREPISRSGSSIRFAVTDKGKTAYYYARWINRKGQAGPWSPLVSGIIH